MLTGCPPQGKVACIRFTLDPALDSTDVPCLLTLDQGRKKCLSKHRCKGPLHAGSALFSVARLYDLAGASVVVKGYVCHIMKDAHMF